MQELHYSTKYFSCLVWFWEYYVWQCQSHWTLLWVWTCQNGDDNYFEREIWCFVVCHWNKILLKSMDKYLIQSSQPNSTPKTPIAGIRNCKLVCWDEFNIIARPHFLVRATINWFPPARATFRSVLSNERQWLQPLLVLTVRWWPDTSKCGRAINQQ